LPKPQTARRGDDMHNAFLKCCDNGFQTDKEHELYEQKEVKKETHVEEMEVLDSGAILGSVYSLETFSTMDGPGICTNIFLQGCPKKCLFCCNPEMQALADPNQYPEFAMSSAEVVSSYCRQVQRVTQI
jgi:hypothetical protein